MTWHVLFSQHYNQIGFALTVAYVDGRELSGELAGLMACNECGVDTPLAQIEFQFLAWTVMLIAHKKEQQ